MRSVLLLTFLLVVLFEPSSGFWGRRRSSRVRFHRIRLPKITIPKVRTTFCRLLHRRTVVDLYNNVIGCVRKCPKNHQELYSMKFGHYCKPIQCSNGCTQCSSYWNCNKCNYWLALQGNHPGYAFCVIRCHIGYRKKFIGGTARCVRQGRLTTTSPTTKKTIFFTKPLKTTMIPKVTTIQTTTTTSTTTVIPTTTTTLTTPTKPTTTTKIPTTTKNPTTTTTSTIIKTTKIPTTTKIPVATKNLTTTTNPTTTTTTIPTTTKSPTTITSPTTTTTTTTTPETTTTSTTTTTTTTTTSTTTKAPPKGCKDRICSMCEDDYFKLVTRFGISTCIKNCPEGYTTLGAICVACADTRCASCNESIAECKRCLPGFSMHMGSENSTTECVRYCPKEYIKENKDGVVICSRKEKDECPIENCMTCTGPSKVKVIEGCQQCKTGFKLFRGTLRDYCYTSCPPQYYSLMKNVTNTAICDKCEITFCHKCDRPDVCNECIEPMVLNTKTGECEMCPPYTIYNYEDRKCVPMDLDKMESSDETNEISNEVTLVGSI